MQCQAALKNSRHHRRLWLHAQRPALSTPTTQRSTPLARPFFLVPPLFFWHPALHISAQRTDRFNHCDLCPKSLWYVPCSHLPTADATKSPGMAKIVHCSPQTRWQTDASTNRTEDPRSRTANNNTNAPRQAMLATNASKPGRRRGPSVGSAASWTVNAGFSPGGIEGYVIPSPCHHRPPPPLIHVVRV